MNFCCAVWHRHGCIQLFYDRHAGCLQSAGAHFVRQKCGGRADAGCFLAGLAKAGQFEGTGAPAAWLRMAHNRAIDQIRRQRP